MKRKHLDSLGIDVSNLGEEIRNLLDEYCFNPAEKIGMLEAIKHDILQELREEG